jgi:DNA-binding protein HU-beta
MKGLTMNKQDLINEIAANGMSHYDAGLSKTVVTAVLDTLGEVAQKQLIKPGAELILPGIGKLKSVHKPARTGRHPKTGEEIEIAAKTTVKFVVAKALKDAVE